MSVLKRPKLGGAVYILPNLLTTGNLFYGFYSIVKSLQGDYQWAAAAIVLATIFDILDGRVARLTGGSSEFGVQYDSLCDLISFGLAPSILMYNFGLNVFGRIGWIFCFLYLACGALRLARFNVQSSIGKSSGDFTGLPIPMAALVVASFVATLTDLKETGAKDFWFIQDYLLQLLETRFHNFALAVIAPVLAIAMVSNIAYRSHKVIKISFVKPFKLLVLLVIVLGFFAYQPQLFGLVFSLTYAFSGLFEWLIGWKKAHDDDEIFQPFGEDDSVMEPSGNADQAWQDLTGKGKDK
jgi:CDP-diacylglycerol--serine O-phosphatidyltransferase